MVVLLSCLIVLGCGFCCSVILYLTVMGCDLVMVCDLLFGLLLRGFRLGLICLCAVGFVIVCCGFLGIWCGDFAWVLF